MSGSGTIDPQWLMPRLEALAHHTESDGQLTRTWLSEAHVAAAACIVEWMREAGMDATRDCMGNVVGRYEGAAPGAPALILGSHFDTVRNAGRYDGTLGVVVAIACVEALHVRGRRLPLAVEVVAFGDEEGVRFGATLLGSRALAGRFDPALLELRDSGGGSMAEALRAAGLDPAGIPALARRREDLLGFVEVHIEQGPVLENEGLPVGIVSAIAGATRLRVTLEGRSGHAGTVPMALRRDALAAAAEIVLAVEALGRDTDELVATTGVLEVPDAATNVIPGRVELGIDLRCGNDDVREGAVALLLSRITEVTQRRGIVQRVRRVHDASAVRCASALTGALEAAVRRAGYPPRRLPSGAGHDAMAMAAITDMAMLFVRCGNGGTSHHPAESVEESDALAAARVLLDFLEHFQPGI